MIRDFTLSPIPPEDEALRLDVRNFLHKAIKDIPADERARSWFGYSADFSRKLAEQGWVGISLPKAYGGQERGYFARFVISEELLAVGAPVSAHWIADRQSGPLIAKFGSEVQKSFYLPKICNAEAFFCIGMSEPNSGSDLASVSSRAEKVQGGWRLNGRKIWTTNAHGSHYMIALVRTSGTATDRNKGLSQFIIDLSSPGITIRQIEDLTGDKHFSEVFFDDVFLTDECLVGSEGAGWDQVIAELAFERSGPERIYSSIVLLEEWLNHLRSQETPKETALVLLGRMATHLSVLRQMSMSVTSMLVAGHSPVIEAALVKDLGTEFEQVLPTLIGDALNSEMNLPPALLRRTLNYVTLIAPIYSLRGGTREILRGMIARGLGLR